MQSTQHSPSFDAEEHMISLRPHPYMNGDAQSSVIYKKTSTLNPLAGPFEPRAASGAISTALDPLAPCFSPRFSAAACVRNRSLDPLAETFMPSKRMAADSTDGSKRGQLICGLNACASEFQPRSWIELNTSEKPLLRGLHGNRWVVPSDDISTVNSPIASATGKFLRRLSKHRDLSSGVLSRARSAMKLPSLTAPLKDQVTMQAPADSQEASRQRFVDSINSPVEYNGEEWCHHINWLGNPVLEENETSAALCLAIIMSSAKGLCFGPQSDLYKSVLAKQAMQLVDPVYYAGPIQYLRTLSGTALQNATAGYTFKAYSPVGFWRHVAPQNWDVDGERPRLDTLRIPDYSDACVILNGWYQNHGVPTRATFIEDDFKANERRTHKQHADFVRRSVQPAKRSALCCSVNSEDLAVEDVSDVEPTSAAPLGDCPSTQPTDAKLVLPVKQRVRTWNEPLIDWSDEFEFLDNSTPELTHAHSTPDGSESDSEVVEDPINSELNGHSRKVSAGSRPAHNSQESAVLGSKSTQSQLVDSPEKSDCEDGQANSQHVLLESPLGPSRDRSVAHPSTRRRVRSKSLNDLGETSVEAKNAQTSRSAQISRRQHRSSRSRSMSHESEAEIRQMIALLNAQVDAIESRYPEIEIILDREPSVRGPSRGVQRRLGSGTVEVMDTIIDGDERLTGEYGHEGQTSGPDSAAEAQELQTVVSDSVINNFGIGEHAPLEVQKKRRCRVSFLLPQPVSQPARKSAPAAPIFNGITVRPVFAPARDPTCIYEPTPRLPSFTSIRENRSRPRRGSLSSIRGSITRRLSRKTSKSAPALTITSAGATSALPKSANGAVHTYTELSSLLSGAKKAEKSSVLERMKAFVKRVSSKKR